MVLDIILGGYAPELLLLTAIEQWLILFHAKKVSGWTWHRPECGLRLCSFPVDPYPRPGWGWVPVFLASNLLAFAEERGSIWMESPDGGYLYSASISVRATWPEKPSFSTCLWSDTSSWGLRSCGPLSWLKLQEADGHSTPVSTVGLAPDEAGLEGGFSWLSLKKSVRCPWQWRPEEMLSRAGFLPDGDKGTVTSELPLADKAVNIGLYTRYLAQRPGTFTFVGCRWNPIYVSIALLDTMNTEDMMAFRRHWVLWWSTHPDWVLQHKITTLLFVHKLWRHTKRSVQFFLLIQWY